MRISSFEVRNYKGLAHAAANDLGAQNVVVISGKNGTGKSLLLEALVSAWTNRLWRTSENVGPWADTLRVSITVEFTEDEWLVIDDWHHRFNGNQPAPRLESTLLTEFGQNGSIVANLSTPAIDIARQQAFQREHGFGVIDFLPAIRLVSAGPTQAVDIAMLGVERVEQERTQGLDQVISSGAPIALPNIGNYLMTLDYQRFLAERQGDVASDDYERMAEIFRTATGKRLLPPIYDPMRGSSVSIELPSGQRHGLNALSSGEKEMLGMSYYVRRLSAAGGVLCIDEPEQHLHPSLQSALFENMQDIAERAQIWVVSHSAAIIASASRSSLLEVTPASDAVTNQVTRLTDDSARTELLGVLGISQADLLQADALLIVEGPTDARWLPLLYPVEVGRTRIISAGSAAQVLQTYDALSSVPTNVPFLCVRDRDLLSDEEVERLKSLRPNLFVWPRRAIESMILDGALISSALRGVGKELGAQEIEQLLATAAQSLRADVLLSMVDAELTSQFPPPAARTGGDAFSKLEGHLTDYAEVNSKRAAAVASTRAAQAEILEREWDANWKKLVNPKAVLAAVYKEVGTFKTMTDFMDALIAKCRDDSELRPEGFDAFKAALAAVLPAAPKVEVEVEVER